MRSRPGLRVVGMLLAAFSVRAVPAREADLPKLRAWEMPAYTLIAADGYDPREIVKRFADSERVLSKLLATPVKPTRIPTTVWLVPPTVWNRYLAPGHAIAGEFVPRRFANYLVINADLGRAQLRAGVQHEYAHLFLRTQWGGLYPLWFDEGVAELMRMADLRRNHATFEIPAPVPLVDWVAMPQLFELDKNSREYLEEPGSAAVHRESWALVHRGLLGGGNFGDKMFAYLAAINRLVPVGDAGPDSFGMTFEQLDATMKEYASRPAFAVGRLNYDALPAPRLPDGRVLGESEALETLAHVALDTGFSPDHVGEVIAAADRAAPGAPRVAILKLRLAVRDRQDSEALRLAATLAPREDLATLRDTGLALFERVREPSDERAGDARRAEFEDAAFALLDRALRIDAGDAPAAWAYALLAARRHRSIDTALERLAAARSRMTGHPDLAEATALALEAHGEEGAMMPFLLDALRNTSSPEQRARAARRLSELRIKEREKAPQ